MMSLVSDQLQKEISVRSKQREQEKELKVSDARRMQQRMQEQSVL
jgi:hypothetical protein